MKKESDAPREYDVDIVARELEWLIISLGNGYYATQFNSKIEYRKWLINEVQKLAGDVIRVVINEIYTREGFPEK